MNLTRRDFFKSVAIAGSATLLCSRELFAKIPEEEIPKWDEQWDIIVVGTGFAGIATALSAMQEGVKSVLLIDKMPYFGGNSNLSAGEYAVANTPFQRELGITSDEKPDSWQLHYKDTMESGHNLNDPEIVEIMTSKGLETYEWLTQNGVKWIRVDRDGGHSFSRSHISGSGSKLMKPLRQKLGQMGAVTRIRTIMDELVYNQKGAVVGIKVREKYEFKFQRDFDENDNKSGDVKYYRAIGGVVIATGGWGADYKFRQLLDPKLTPDVKTTNHMGATGYTIQKLMKDNVKTVDMQYIQMLHTTSADEDSFGFGYGFINLGCNFGMMINPKTGQRFVSEIADRRVVSSAILAMNEKGKNHPVLIMDYETTKEVVPLETLQLGMEAGAVFEFATLDELIDHFKINKEPFLEQLKLYNEYVMSGNDPQFGRTFEKRNGKFLTIKSGPFFASRPGPKIHHCMGGVKTNTKCQVIDNDGNVINGLYACGEVTGGRHGFNRLGSNAVLECNVFGRIAGKAAAARYKDILSRS